MIQGSVAWPVKAMMVSRVASRHINICSRVSVTCRFTRSAIAPPWSVNSRTGSEPSALTRPTANALSVSVSTSHPSATDCIQVPQRETNWPMMK